MGFRRYAVVLGSVVSCLVVTLPGAALAAPAGAWRNVTFEGVSLEVPASWPVVNLAAQPLACPRLDVHAVYLGTPGPDPVCPAGLHGKTEAVQIEPASPQSPDAAAAGTSTVIGGRPARTNADAAVTHTIIDILPAAGIEVGLSYGSNRALARRIQATIRIGPAARPVSAAALLPASPVRPAPAQGLFQGPGFDTCAAPSESALNSWLASPFRAVGIYIGGINRACAQANLTDSWTSAAQAEGWSYFPLYPGRQASCVKAFGDATITRSKAAAQGTAAAQDAATQAQSLGIPQGTPIVYDMEAYAGCGPEVITFLNSWDAELHVKGYLAAVYESFSNIGDLVSAATRITEPDVIYYADWDGHATTQSSYMPASMWTGHRRIHQYQGSHEVTWGGVTMDIDNDQLNVGLGKAPKPKPAPAQSAVRIAVGINANGSAEWFAKAANGTLIHSYQHPLGSSGWAATATVGDSPADIVSNPAVTADADGNLALFAADGRGQLQHAWQHSSAPDGWQWGGPVGAAGTTGTIRADPAALRRPGGDIQVFVTTAGGSVATTREVKPDDETAWTRWNSLHGSCASSPAAFTDASGRLEVFCTTTRGTLAADTRTGGAWHGWATVGASPSGLRGAPAIVSDGAGQTEAFAATTAGGLVHAWQRTSTGAWTWGIALAGAATSTKIKQSPAAAAWPGGRVVVLSRLANGRLGYILQTGSTGSAGWTSWNSISGKVLSSPAGWLNASGVPEAAVLISNGRLAVSRYLATGWTSWRKAGSGF
jgi:hypothetical protein